MSILAASALCYNYPSSLLAVSKHKLCFPDFSMSQGDAWLIYGPSGSGKTTLLHLISGIIQDYEGSLLFEDKELKGLRPSERDLIRHEKMGNIYQSFNLISYLSVLENILLPAKFLGKNFNDRALELIQRVGLQDFLDRPTHALSMGQQQRVAAVRALLLKPQILLADEPTSALDPKNKAIFMEILLELCKEEKTTLIFVSHDPSLHSQFSNRLDLSQT